MIMWGFFARESACVIISIPPTMTEHFTPIRAPRASNCSDIWNANSRVGVRTSAKRRCGCSRRLCKMGNAKAPVLPEPVSANPIMSFPVESKIQGIYLIRLCGKICSFNSNFILKLPFRANGIDSLWIFDGFFHCRLSQASQSTSTRP